MYLVKVNIAKRKVHSSSRHYDTNVLSGSQCTKSIGVSKRLFVLVFVFLGNRKETRTNTVAAKATWLWQFSIQSTTSSNCQPSSVPRERRRCVSLIKIYICLWQGNNITFYLCFVFIVIKLHLNQPSNCLFHIFLTFGPLSNWIILRH